MSLTITRRGRHKLLAADGSVISQHTDLKEAYERASGLPPGSYTLVTADEVIVVAGAAPAPTPPPVPPPPPSPVPPPVPVPVPERPTPQPDPAPTPVDLFTATDAAGRVWSFNPADVSALGSRVMADGVAVYNGAWGSTSSEVWGVAFRLIAGVVYVRQATGQWLASDPAGFVPTETAADGGPVPRGSGQVTPPPVIGPPVLGGTTAIVGRVAPAPASVPRFPLPNPMPPPPPVRSTNPKRLRIADITPVIDEATGEPWCADVSLAPGPNIYQSLADGKGFRLRRVDGDLRVVYAVGGNWTWPTIAREFSLAGVEHGRNHAVRWTHAWEQDFSGETFSPGDYVGLWIDPRNPDRILTCGSMDYTTIQIASVFDRTVGPNGAVADLAVSAFGHITASGIEGLNGKECMGGFALTPLWMQATYGMGSMMILGGNYTSLVAQAATASMGLFGATFNEADLRLPRQPDQIVPVRIFADHRNGSQGADWFTPLDEYGQPKPTYAPGQQPFDRGACCGPFVQNWLDGSRGIANASRTTLWKVRIDGDVCTTLEGPPWAPMDQGTPDLDLFAWWNQGVEIMQHGVTRTVYPISHVGFGHYEGYTFVGEKRPVRFVEAIDKTHFRMDTDLGTVEEAYFIGPDVEGFYRELGFDDRNQWDRVSPDGSARWTWGTGYLQTPTVIADDDGNQRGALVCLFNGMLGQVFYNHSTFQADARVAEWHIFDLDELGQASQGHIAPHLVQPAEMAVDPILTDDCQAFGKTEGVLYWGQWSSLDWDRETNELYVFGNMMGSRYGGGQLRIRKYRVNRSVA